MPNTSKHPKQKGPAVRQLFEIYKRNIAEHVIEAYGSSYQTYETVGDTWVKTLRYTPAIEKDIINTSKFFVRMLDTRDSKSTDPNFLYSLMDSISEFLGEYTVRKKPGTVKRLETERLMHILWEENSYIRGLLARQARKRQARSAKAFRKKEEKKKRIEKAQQERKFVNQVKYEFVSVSFYRRK